MFVDLLSDIRSTLKKLVFRAQLAAPQPRPAMPRRLVLSGPSDSPPTSPAAAPTPVAQEETDPLAAAMGGSVRRVGAGAATSVAALRTNRGEEPSPQKPVTVDDKVGRNDPCPCGSGKKYKKCHGVGAA